MKERMVRFRVVIPGMERMPTRAGHGRGLTRQQRIDRAAQAARQRARALLLVSKTKPESVASEVETLPPNGDLPAVYCIPENQPREAKLNDHDGTSSMGRIIR
jgi:hypothetical protein